MRKAPVPPTSNSQWYWTDNRARATAGQPSHSTRHTLSLHTATFARKKPAEAHAQLDQKVLVDMKMLYRLQGHRALCSAHDSREAQS